MVSLNQLLLLLAATFVNVATPRDQQIVHGHITHHDGLALLPSSGMTRCGESINYNDWFSGNIVRLKIGPADHEQGAHCGRFINILKITDRAHPENAEVLDTVRVVDYCRWGIPGEPCEMAASKPLYYKYQGQAVTWALF